MVPVLDGVTDGVAEREEVVVCDSGIKDSDAVFELVREKDRVVDGVSPGRGRSNDGAKDCVAVADDVGDFVEEIVDDGVPLVESEPVPVLDAVIDDVAVGVGVSVELSELLAETDRDAPRERVPVGVTVLDGVFVGVTDEEGEPEIVSVDVILGVPVLELVSVGVAVIDDVPVREVDGLEE